MSPGDIRNFGRGRSASKRPSRHNLPPNVPVWAKERLEQLLDVGKQTKASDSKIADGYVKTDRSEERAVLDHWSNKRALIRYQGEDNDPERDSNPEPNIVENPGSKHFVRGDFGNGQFLSEYGEVLSFTQLEGDVSHSVFLRKENEIGSYRRQDAQNPKQSVVISTVQTEDFIQQETPKTEHFGATSFAAELLDLSQKKDATLEEQAASLFFGQRDNLPQVRSKITSEIHQQVNKLPKAEQAPLKKLLAEPSAHTPRRLNQELLRLAKKAPKDKKLSKLRDLSGAWQILEDAPKLMADGLLRNQEFYVSPGSLNLSTAAQNWDFDKELGLPIADSVIIGGGPGGLATGYHLSEQGNRTVIFEGGKIGQAFSDASAKSVHQLRTNQNSSNLTYTYSNNDIGISLNRNSRPIREKGQKAKDDWYQAIGETSHSDSEGSFSPLNRNNLFEHMAQMGHALAHKYPDTFMIENSPVSDIEKLQRGEDTLFRIKSEKGHEVLTRSLVMATGFVGTNGEYARGLKQFSEIADVHPDKVTVLQSDHDLVRKNEELLENDKAMVFSDRLLGRPELRNWIKGLPEGSRLAVIGSGESAAKGAVEALHLNPGLSLDLYTKNPLEPYQVQIPASHFSFSGDIPEAAIKHRDVADRTLKQFEELKTPITTETMKTLLRFEAEGRLRVKELGDRFDESTVDVSLKDNRFHFKLKDEEVASRVKEQRESWVKSGLYGDSPPDLSADELQPVVGVMVAVGYNSNKVNASPLMQQLIDQDLVSIEDGRVQYGEDGLTSSLSSQVGFNTAGAVRMSADTALPGRAVRGLRLAQRLGGQLPEREKPTDVPVNYGETDPEYDPPDKAEVLRRLSLKPITFRPEFAKITEGWAQKQDPSQADWYRANQKLGERFNGPNEILSTLVGRYFEHPEALSPVETLTAQRALQIVERLENSEFA